MAYKRHSPRLLLCTEPASETTRELADFVQFLYDQVVHDKDDQVLILLGQQGSGKTATYHHSLTHLLQSTSVSHPKHLVKGIKDAESILSAFGHASASESHFDASRFGRYVEVQYTPDGILGGYKILDFNLQKDIVHSNATAPDGQNYHIFYHLLAGASAEEKSEWRLTEPHTFHYLGKDKASKMPVKSGIKTGSTLVFGAMRKHLKSIGCGPRMQKGLFQLLSAILHLGNVQFDIINRQESCGIRNKPQLAFVASLFGVSRQDLEMALTSKSTVAGKEKCTVILGTLEASEQRDRLAAFLYSLLFSWLVEQINSTYCMNEDELYHFVALLDFPGIAQNVKYAFGFEQLLINFMDEKLTFFAKTQLCDKLCEVCDDDELPSLVHDLKRIENQQELLTLLGKPSTGLLDRLAQRQPTHREMITISRSNVYLVVPDKQKKPTTTAFSIRHTVGSIDYKISDFASSRSDAYLCADFVSLFGRPANPGAPNATFIRHLFVKQRIAVECDPRSPTTLLKANASNAPTRRPSVRNRKESTSTQVNSQSAGPVAQLLTSFEDMLQNVSDATTRVVYHTATQGEKKNGPLQDLCPVRRGLFGEQGLALLKDSPSSLYDTSLSHAEFLYRYLELHSRTRAFENSKEECEAVISELGWAPETAIAGATRVFMNRLAWETLSLRAKKVDKAEMDSEPTTVIESDDEDMENAEEEEEDEHSDDFILESDELTAQDKTAMRKMPDLETGRNRKRIFDYIKPAESKGKYPAQLTRQRKVWLCCTWFTTWWIPSSLLSCCKMKNRDIQIAFREKLALCAIIAFMCGVMLFFIVGFGRLICPKTNIMSAGEVSTHRTLSDPYVIVSGKYYIINDIVQTHVYGGTQAVPGTTFEATTLGQDVSAMFYQTDFPESYCPGYTLPAGWDNSIDRGGPGSAQNIWYPHRVRSADAMDYLVRINYMAKGNVARDKEWIQKYLASEAQNTKIVVAWDRVYDVSSYYLQTNLQGNGSGFLGPFVKQIFDLYGPLGKDATKAFNQFSNPTLTGQQSLAEIRRCMDGMFFTGVVDHRNDTKCIVGNYILLISSVMLFLIISVKFLASLQFDSQKTPEDQDRFVICQVPCYTEGYESLRKTIDSMAKLDYDSQRKLLFIVCDGMIIGHGNDRPTPRIVLDILGVDPDVDPEPVAFQSVGEGNRQLNMAKVYSGLYRADDNEVPFVVIVKVGKPSERQRPGNRGKRDSQMILMRFLNRVHYQAPMSPLEVEIYTHIKNSIGIHPFFYEYIFMVDADTEVASDSLKRLVSSMVNDSRVMGLCGETKMANEKASWVTMIQVYEYFISHHMSKAFEALFGCVTCLPGCFTMYRIRNAVKNKPVLVCNEIISSYSESKVDTLHLKNLLELGEDRYLTTLMLKTHPMMKTSFNVDAKCSTVAPDRWSILLSQRRRWINSTVHNLFELMMVQQLCGFCFFSMRFIVIVDLFGTMVQPAALLYVGYLAYIAATDTTSVFPLVSIIMIGCIYGFQVLIILFKREFHHLGWMILYILAIPLFSFYIPIYSFWRFDDFSWGNTRRVVGEDGKAEAQPEVEKFDISSIPQLPYPDKQNVLPPVFEDDTTEVEDDSTERKLNSSELAAPIPFQQQLMPALNHIPLSSLPPSAEHSRSVTPMSAPGSVRGQMMAYAPAPSPIPVVYQPVYHPMTALQAIQAPPQQPHVTDELLIMEINRILSQSDLSKLTKKQVRADLATIFQTDLSSKKAYINMVIDKILQGDF